MSHFRETPHFDHFRPRSPVLGHLSPYRLQSATLDIMAMSLMSLIPPKTPSMGPKSPSKRTFPSFHSSDLYTPTSPVTDIYPPIHVCPGFIRPNSPPPAAKSWHLAIIRRACPPSSVCPLADPPPDQLPPRLPLHALPTPPHPTCASSQASYPCLDLSLSRYLRSFAT